MRSIQKNHVILILHHTPYFPSLMNYLNFIMVHWFIFFFSMWSKKVDFRDLSNFFQLLCHQMNACIKNTQTQNSSTTIQQRIIWKVIYQKFASGVTIYYFYNLKYPLKITYITNRHQNVVTHDCLSDTSLIGALL